MIRGEQNSVFLCHASEDKSHAISMYKRLKAEGFNPWLDSMDILPGDNWDQEIRTAIKKAAYVIVFFSRLSVSKRGYVQREFKLILDALEEIPEGQSFIIPVRIDDCQIPLSFQRIQYIDLFEKEGISKVILSISRKKLQTKTKGKRGRFTDPRDGQIYKTVELLGKTWLAENLNFKLRRDCWYFHDKPDGKMYGYLYTWDSAQKACPPGWRLPGLDEIDDLFWSFEDSEKAYDALMAPFPFLRSGKSGFNARLGGCRYLDGGFGDQLFTGFYWCSTEKNAQEAWFYRLGRPSINGKYVDRFSSEKGFGFSVRCVKIH